MSVYFVQDDQGNIKIGKSDNPKLRFMSMRYKYNIVKLLAVVDGGLETEAEYHKRFKEYKIRGYRDWFTPGNKLVEYIRELGQGKGDISSARFDNEPVAPKEYQDLAWTSIRIYTRDKPEFDALVWRLTEQAKRPVAQAQAVHWLLQLAREYLESEAK